MDIVITVLITALMTSLIVYGIMNSSIEKKIGEMKKEIKTNYENLYFKKENQLKGYYIDLFETEYQKNKNNLKLERKRYDEMLLEANETALREKQLLMMQFRQSRIK